MINHYNYHYKNNYFLIQLKFTKVYLLKINFKQFYFN